MSATILLLVPFILNNSQMLILGPQSSSPLPECKGSLGQETATAGRHEADPATSSKYLFKLTSS